MTEHNEFNPSLNYLRAKYFEYLLARNLSKHTIKFYNYMLNHFFKFMEDNGIKSHQEISKKVILDYQIFVSQEQNKSGKANSISAQNSKLKAPVSFCKFLYEQEFIKEDPTKGIKYTKQPKLLPRNVPTEDELVKILKQPNINNPTGLRDRTILEVLYSTGIRKSELINLDLSDVDYKQGTMIIRQGKGSKDRYVPVGRIACQFLETYIHHIRGLLLKGKPDSALFVSQEGKRISPAFMDYVINKYSKKSCIGKKFSTHSFRHACATHLVNRGLDIRHVQALLGHSCLSSTQIYTKVGIEDLKKVIKKHHPREKQFIHNC